MKAENKRDTRVARLRENRIWYFRSSTAREYISLGWKTRIFLSEFHPWRVTSPSGTRWGRECEKAKAEPCPRAEEVVGGLATELFKSRPGFPRPPLLDSFATVETKEISFRRPARGMFEGRRGAWLFANRF